MRTTWAATHCTSRQRRRKASRTPAAPIPYRYQLQPGQFPFVPFAADRRGKSDSGFGGGLHDLVRPALAGGHEAGDSIWIGDQDGPGEFVVALEDFEQLTVVGQCDRCR